MAATCAVVNEARTLAGFDKLYGNSLIVIII